MYVGRFQTLESVVAFHAVADILEITIANFLFIWIWIYIHKYVSIDKMMPSKWKLNKEHK